MADLAGETAVVTGAAQGIGRTISATLASRGAHVVVTDIQDGSETVATIEELDGTAEFREGDVTDEASMRDVFEGLDVDVLVNNAGYYAPLVGNLRQFDEIERDEWDRVLEVNTTGVFVVTKAALPQFNDGGRVVNISSGVVLRGTPGFLHYVASKAAVIGMTRAMAAELGDRAIRVNAIAPGLTASDASLKIGEDRIESRAAEDQCLKRAIQPQDIADVIGFLAGHESEMMTGQVVNVDGGNTFY